MAQRALALVGLAHLRHGQRRHGARAYAGALDRGFQHQRVHDGRQHAHRVGRRPRQPVLGNLRAAQNIAAADDDAEPDAELMRGDEVSGEAVDGRLMDAEFFRTAQGFAGELDDHPSVFRLRHGDVAPLAAAPRPSCYPCPRTASAIARAADARPRCASMRAGKCRDFAAEIALGPVDTFAERVAHEAGDLDRRRRPCLRLSLSACATLFLSSKMKG